MSKYKFDRTVFKMQTFKEAENANIFDKNVSYSERLQQAWYLISQAYGFSMSDQPRLDRNYHSTRKMGNVMGTIFNDDFRDFIHALNNNNVDYILVGGYAVILHGYRRVTGDMDIWVNRTKENYSKLFLAFKEFGLPVFEMTEQKFLDPGDTDVFSYGRPPVSIDIITKLKGVEFNEAFSQAVVLNEDNLMIRFIHLNNLIQAKKAAGRHKDLDDIEKLTSGN